MKRKWLLLVLFFPIILSGCLVISFYPLYTEDDLFPNEILLGEWMDQDSAWWKFDYQHKGEDKIHECDSTTYVLKIRENNESDYSVSSLSVHVVHLENYYFLDFYCEDYLEGENITFFEMHLVPVHTFAKVTINKNSLAINWLDIKWLEKMIKKRKLRIRYENNGENILLTSKTKDLQKFVLKNANKDEAFKEGYKVNLTRIGQ